MTRTMVRFDTARRVGRLAAEEPDGGGNAAADHEPGDRCADDRGLLVLRQLGAPVRELLDLRLEVGDRVRELAAGLLDGGADLGGRTLRHQLCSRISVRVRLAS